MTDIYLHIVARMADYMATQPLCPRVVAAANKSQRVALATAMIAAVLVRVRADIIGHARINMYVNISHAWFTMADYIRTHRKHAIEKPEESSRPCRALSAADPIAHPVVRNGKQTRGEESARRRGKINQPMLLSIMYVLPVNVLQTCMYVL